MHCIIVICENSDDELDGLFDVDDQQPEDTNVDDVDDPQAVSEDEEGLMAAVLR